MNPELRETLGRNVRMVWIKWAEQQPTPKPSWLVPWEGLSEPDKEVDRQIGESLYNIGLENGCASFPKDQRILAGFDHSVNLDLIIRALALFREMGITDDDFGLQHNGGTTVVFGGTNRLVACAVKFDEHSTQWEFALDRGYCVASAVAAWDQIPVGRKMIITGPLA